jgi:hypothetical protein
VPVGLYSARTAVAMLSAMALAGAGFGQSPRLINLGGLFQRARVVRAGRAQSIPIQPLLVRSAPVLFDNGAADQHRHPSGPGSRGTYLVIAGRRFT